MIRQVMLIGLSLTLLAGGARAGEATFKTCYARWTTTDLTIGNAHIERSWRIDDGRLTATSFRDVRAGVEWLSKTSIRPAPRSEDAVSNGHASPRSSPGAAGSARSKTSFKRN